MTINNRDFTTDNNLNKILENYFGYKELCEKPSRDLYFTNLIPGYRKDNKSTGNNKQVIEALKDEDVNINFKKLVALINPKVVVCLGRLVSQQVGKMYDDNFRIRRFNEFIDAQFQDEGFHPKMIGEGNTIPMFAMAHLGGLGVANRNKYLEKTTYKYDKDWERLAKYVESLSVPTKDLHKVMIHEKTFKY